MMTDQLAKPESIAFSSAWTRSKRPTRTTLRESDCPTVWGTVEMTILGNGCNDRKRLLRIGERSIIPDAPIDAPTPLPW
jgi:hypothetical protein